MTLAGSFTGALIAARNEAPNEDQAGVALRGYEAAKAYWAFIKNPIQAVTELHKNFGNVVAVGPIVPFPRSRLHVLVVGAHYNRIVLTDTETFHTGGLTIQGREGSVVRRLRDGMVSINGEEQAYYRKLLLAPFSRKSIDGLIPQIRAIVQAELETWPQGQTLDLWRLCRRLMQRISIAVLFSRSQADRDIFELADLVNEYFRLSASVGVRLFPIAFPGSPFSRMNKIGKEIEAAAKAIFDKQTHTEFEQNLFSLLTNAKDQKGNPRKVGEIVPHLVQLFGASYETCQTSLAWTLILLTQFPDAYRCVAEEAGRNDPEGSYLDWVLKESMRLFPPIPLQRRIVSRPTTSLGLELPPGTNVFLPAFLTNRNPAIFQSPNAFLPARWASCNPSQYEFLTFGGGPRTCIGAWFAMTALRIAIAEIVSRFHIEIWPETRIDTYVSVSMSPRNTVPATLTPHDGKHRPSKIRGNILQMFEHAVGD